MIADHHVISVPLIPPDASAAMKLRTALEEMRGFNKTFSVEIGPANEIILHADSELRLEQIVDYLKRGFGLEFQAGAPQVAYREAITKELEWEYTHKKRTQGGSEYAKLKIHLMPGQSGSGFNFDSIARDDAVPPIFISAVLKGLKAAAQRGPIAGFPLMDLHCKLIDGDHHDAESTREVFETAARVCLREALPRAAPRLLHPMMAVIVATPEDCLGEVIGDLNSRQGVVRGMESLGIQHVVTALVPLANMFGYPHSLRMSTGRYIEYIMAFSHYEQLPKAPPPGDDPFAPAAALRS